MIKQGDRAQANYRKSETLPLAVIMVVAVNVLLPEEQRLTKGRK